MRKEIRHAACDFSYEEKKNFKFNLKFPGKMGFSLAELNVVLIANNYGLII